MDQIEENVVDRRAALRRLGGLTAAGVVGATATTLLSAQTAGAQTAPTAGMLFHPINPYRSVDTRRAGEAGRLSSGFSFQFSLVKDLDGNLKIPAEAGAVTYNLTVTQTSGDGFLALTPADGAYLGISSINWKVPNADIANGGTVALGPSPLTGPGSVTVNCGGFASTFFIIDVTGYYAPAAPA